MFPAYLRHPISQFHFSSVAAAYCSGLDLFLSGQAPDKSVTENYFSYFSAKTYAVGIQKNSLGETVLLKTQNTCLN